MFSLLKVRNIYYCFYTLTVTYILPKRNIFNKPFYTHYLYVRIIFYTDLLSNINSIALLSKLPNLQNQNVLLSLLYLVREPVCLQTFYQDIPRNDVTCFIWIVILGNSFLKKINSSKWIHRHTQITSAIRLKQEHDKFIFWT